MSEFPSGPRAGFFQRFGALIVDWVMLAVISYVIELAIGRTGGSALGFFVWLAYFGFFEGSASGQTIGKRVVGVRVIDVSGGGSIGYGRAVVRTLGKIVSAFVFLLGYFWMLWDRERQCWHDKFANDVVVPVSSHPVAHWPN
jgi:uncharacterized RDD family membrane protein YckC